MSRKHPMSPSFRGNPSLSPVPQNRQTSIVEMLSSPPLLDDINSLDLQQSANSSLSSVILSQQRTGSSIANSDFECDSNSAFNLSRNASVTSASQYLNGASLEWQDIQLSELVEKNKLIRINSKISVEEAFQTLVNNGLTSVPVEEFENDLNCLTFDYTDLNAYLLLVLNKIKAENLKSMDYPIEEIPLMVKKAQTGNQVPVSFVIRLTNKNPFIKLTENDTISTVVEILGTGVHRMAITKDDKLTGIISQRRLVKFLWDNARRFPSMEPLLQSSIKSLHIGSANPISIYGDQLLIEALMKMHDLKMSSLAVVDRNYHLLGNISVTDVRLVSTSSKSDLLYKSCLHFISVILNSRGLENGKDSFPIFHVTSHTSLGRAIAKLVATKSHRLWIVNPDPTTPSTVGSTSLPGTPDSSHSIHSFHNHQHSGDDDGHTGTLVGVLSLTDILSIFAKALGKNHVDPSIARKQRRRSSSGTTNSSVRSLEGFRKSISSEASSSGGTLSTTSDRRH
ncbi:Sds24 protein [Martiniozyma asiatica (nom. inval.)]|nr:Sds24 protein [Martiniozyma asiatica]